MGRKRPRSARRATGGNETGGCCRGCARAPRRTTHVHEGAACPGAPDNLSQRHLRPRLDGLLAQEHLTRVVAPDAPAVGAARVKPDTVGFGGRRAAEPVDLIAKPSHEPRHAGCLRAPPDHARSAPACRRRRGRSVTPTAPPRDPASEPLRRKGLRRGLTGVRCVRSFRRPAGARSPDVRTAHPQRRQHPRRGPRPLVDARRRVGWPRCSKAPR